MVDSLSGEVSEVPEQSELVAWEGGYVSADPHTPCPKKVSGLTTPAPKRV
jgi:hypothetical protein